MYRKGGRYGPYWFDYGDTRKESPWRPIEGAFTRFGDVLPLLREPDDMYVVMGPGRRSDDSVRRELSGVAAAGMEARLPALHRWVDQGLRSEHGVRDDGASRFRSTARSHIPYGPTDAYPNDGRHQRYLAGVQHARRWPAAWITVGGRKAGTAELPE